MDLLVRRWSPVLLVVLALAGAGWAAAGGSGLTGGTLPPRDPTPLDPSAPAPGSGTPAAPPTAAGAEDVPAAEVGWIGTVVTVLFLAVVATVVGVFLYVGVRHLLTERVARREIVDRAASQPPDAAADLEQVREAVRAGLAEVDAGGDPRRAVIACWLRLERLAAAAGSARLAADTPSDLVARLLADHRVGGRALAQLASAYRRARYAPAEVAGELLVTARQALQEVDSQLGTRLRAEPRG